MIFLPLKEQTFSKHAFSPQVEEIKMKTLFCAKPNNLGKSSQECMCWGGGGIRYFVLFGGRAHPTLNTAFQGIGGEGGASEEKSAAGMTLQVRMVEGRECWNL